MKTSRTDKTPLSGSPVAMPMDGGTSVEGGVRASWTRFWFTPIDPFGLHIIRVMAGLLFLTFLLPFAGHVNEYFGLHGWLDEQGLKENVQLFRDELRRDPTLKGLEGTILPGWSILYLFGASPQWLTTAYWISIAVLVLYTIGVAPRVTALLTWVVIASFTANPAMEYEGDALLLMLSFYLMLGYLLTGQRSAGVSLWNRLVKPAGCGCFLAARRSEKAGPPSVGANLALRLLQVHFAILMVTTGLHKLQFGDWWAGVALWFPLFPPFVTKPGDIQAIKPYADSYLLLLNVAAYATLAWQIGFPLFAWKPVLRPVLVIGGLLAWIACAFVYRVPLIGPAVLIGCLSYLSAAEWRRILAWVMPWQRNENALEAPLAAHSGVLAAAGGNR